MIIINLIKGKNKLKKKQYLKAISTLLEVEDVYKRVKIKSNIWIDGLRIILLFYFLFIKILYFISLENISISVSGEFIILMKSKNVKLLHFPKF